MNVGFVGQKYTQGTGHCMLKTVVKTFIFVDLSVKSYLNWAKTQHF